MLFRLPNVCIQNFIIDIHVIPICKQSSLIGDDVYSRRRCVNYVTICEDYSSLCRTCQTPWGCGVEYDRRRNWSGRKFWELFHWVSSCPTSTMQALVGCWTTNKHYLPRTFSCNVWLLAVIFSPDLLSDLVASTHLCYVFVILQNSNHRNGNLQLWPSLRAWRTSQHVKWR